MYDYMILAAGRGARLKPLTDRTPKPLITVAGLRLIELRLLQLAKHGAQRVIINTAYLAPLIQQTLGNGSRYGINICYSNETEALETAGGLALASQYYEHKKVLVFNADIISDFDFSQLGRSSSAAELVLIDNPEHHPKGDFHFVANRLQPNADSLTQTLTFSGIAAYSTELLSKLKPEKQALAPILHGLIAAGHVTAHHSHALWHDIGTLKRLEAAEQDPKVQTLIKQFKR